MTISYLGNFMPLHPDPYSTETHFKKSLVSLGHSVITLQESHVNAEQVLAIASKTDLFIWSKTHGWEIYGMREVLDKLKKLGIPTVAYHLDAFMFIPERWRTYKDHDYLNVEYFFTPDKMFADWIVSNGKKGYYLPAGVFDQECEFIDKKREIPIVFVGSKKYHSSWPYRAKLIDWLSNTYGKQFVHIGNDSPLGIKRGKELNELYNNSKIVIGDSYSPNFAYPYFWSDRIYETTGRGGFIIHPKIKGLEDSFEIGKEIVTYNFNDFRQLSQKIKYYLENKVHRETIRKAGHERTKKDHTYKNRWEYILGVINE